MNNLSIYEFPSIEHKDLILGQLLGRGSYCVVHELKDIILEQTNTPKQDKTSVEEYKANKSTPSKASASSNSVTSDNSNHEVRYYGAYQGCQHEFQDQAQRNINNEGDESDNMGLRNSYQFSTSSIHQDDFSSYQRRFHIDGIYDEEYAKRFIQRRCMRNGLARYAVKKYKSEQKSQHRRNLAAAHKVGKDLPHHQALTEIETEIHILSRISHPNIIKMRAYSSSQTNDIESFIVLDRLLDTLAQTIRGKWTAINKKSKALLFCKSKKQMQRRQLWIDRLVAAYDLASALRHLHKYRIVYRDLKPENGK